MDDPTIMKNIMILIDSDAKNYFESSERLLLMNLLKKLEDGNKLSDNDYKICNKIFKVYNKFLI